MLPEGLAGHKQGIQKSYLTFLSSFYNMRVPQLLWRVVVLIKANDSEKAPGT